MSRVEKKIKSERGASITFALLLFLVCAVLSSIAITAATTASGRLSKLAEMDQRYYAVTSAAELIRDEMEGEEVVIEETVSEGRDPEVKINGEYVDTLDPSYIRVDAAMRLVHIIPVPTEAVPLQYVIRAKCNDEEAIDCNIKESIDENGTIIIKISDAENDMFTLQMRFDADIDTDTDYQSITGKKIIKSSFVWKLAEIKNIKHD